MRVLAIVYEAEDGPGVFGEVIRERGDELDQWMLPESAEPPADPLGYDAVFVLGASANIDQGDRYEWIRTALGVVGKLLEREVPLLGLCLGGQMVAAVAGAVPRRASRPEIGWHPVELTEAGRADPLLGSLPPSFEAFQWHSYEFPLPPGAVELARSEVCLQGCRIGEAAWALQFHPEVSERDALAWTADWQSDPAAIAIGLDPTALALEVEAKIGAFSELGREICGNWLDLAAARLG